MGNVDYYYAKGQKDYPSYDLPHGLLDELLSWGDRSKEIAENQAYADGWENAKSQS